MSDDREYYRELMREHAARRRQCRAEAATFRRKADEQTEILNRLKSGPDYYYAYALRELYLKAEQAAIEAADGHEAHALDYQAAS